MLAAFRMGLAQTGFVEGRNVTIEYRWADGRYDALPALAADLVQRRVAAIVATGGEPSALAAKEATQTIPVIFTSGGDPVDVGLVDSLRRPGGNLTGVHLFFATVSAKRLEMLKELLPRVSFIAVLANPAFASTRLETRDLSAAARTLGLELRILNASMPDEIDVAVGMARELHADAIVLCNDAFFINRRERLISLAAKHALPSIYFERAFPASGGLISYGSSLADGYRQVGAYTGKILRGADPADLPIVQPTRLELVINVKTAKGLGLTIPPSLLTRADEIID